MPETPSDASGTNFAINSPNNISTTGDSTATPIVIGASVAAVALFLSLFFMVFYFIRRRRSEYHYYDDKAAFDLYHVNKEDTLPPEPSPPPPPYKDINSEKDLECGMKPLLPPKDFGRPFVKSKRAVGSLNLVQQTTPPTKDNLALPAFPARTFSRSEGGMF